MNMPSKYSPALARHPFSGEYLVPAPFDPPSEAKFQERLAGRLASKPSKGLLEAARESRAFHVTLSLSIEAGRDG